MISVSSCADVDAENLTAAPEQTGPRHSLFREGRFFLSTVISKFTVQFKSFRVSAPDLWTKLWVGPRVSQHIVNWSVFTGNFCPATNQTLVHQSRRGRGIVCGT